MQNMKQATRQEVLTVLLLFYSVWKRLIGQSVNITFYFELRITFVS
jgi:hypothetical protein